MNFASDSAAAVPMAPMPGVRLIADIGGTNARFALRSASGGWLAQAVLPTAQYATLEQALDAFLERHPDLVPEHVCLAVATPVFSDEVSFTNLAWSFSIKQLQAAYGWKTFRVVNDFAAQVHALPYLRSDEFFPIGRGNAVAHGVKAMVGAGTGLGVGALLETGTLPDGHIRRLAFESEGGHATFAPSTPEEERVVAEAKSRYGHASAERLLSGEGLTLIHEVLHGERLHAALVSSRALSGEAKAGYTVDCFFGALASFAGDIALAFRSNGGVYIGGGIVPTNLALLDTETFRRRFEDKGRFGKWLSTVSIQVVTAAQPAFLGVSALLDEALANS